MKFQFGFSSSLRYRKMRVFGDFKHFGNVRYLFLCTVTLMDSFSVNGQCGTVKHCDHLLSQLQESELQEIVEAATTKQCASAGMNQANYREIQIHGPVQLNRDVQSIHVPAAHKSNAQIMKLLQVFCRQNRCKMHFFEFPKQNSHGTY